jgi:hypothetical protein
MAASYKGLSIKIVSIQEMSTQTKTIGTASPFQICHPERSAAMKYPNLADGRAVEGPRKYFVLKYRHEAFSREFPDAEFAQETSSGYFNSCSLAFALAQHNRSRNL